MPKAKPSQASRLRKFVVEYGEDVFSTDGEVLLCKLCCRTIAADGKDKVTQHVNTAKHQSNVKCQMKSKQPILTFDTSKKSTFSLELCRVFVEANIPIYKINHPSLRNFLQEYTHHTVPDESTLRKTYLKDCYEENITRIRSALKNERIWISIDETTDSKGRNIVNVIVGSLKKEAATRSFLLHVDELQKTNHKTIAKTFDEAIKIIDPDFDRNMVLLFVTDAASYMVKAGKCLQSLYPKMVHVTCAAHGLHRVAENVRSQFPDVDRLVSNIKKVFNKCPARVVLFKGE